MIALVIIRRAHKAHRTDRGAENPTGPKLPDFTLCISDRLIDFYYKILVILVFSWLLRYNSDYFGIVLF